MEVLIQSSSATNFLHKSPKLTHKQRVLKNQISCLFSVKGCSSPRPFSTPKLFVDVKHRTSVIAEAKKKKKKVDSHSFAVKPDEAGPFPEAVLLKEKKVQEDGSFVPEFADAEEEKLFESLNLQLESDLKFENRRHYEVAYLIHEDHEEEVGSINAKVEDFLKEKKGKIWRLSDWGLRRLAYRIKKARSAHYMFINFEIEAKWINDFKNMLEKDERVIRHLVIQRDEAITEDCPPPPELQTMRAEFEVDDEDEDDDWDNEDNEDWDDEEDEEYEEGEEDEEWDEGIIGYADEDGNIVDEDGNIILADEDDVEEDRSRGPSTESTSGKNRTYA